MWLCCVVCVMQSTCRGARSSFFLFQKHAAKRRIAACIRIILGMWYAGLHVAKAAEHGVGCMWVYKAPCMRWAGLYPYCSSLGRFIHPQAEAAEAGSDRQHWAGVRKFGLFPALFPACLALLVGCSFLWVHQHRVFGYGYISSGLISLLRTRLLRPFGYQVLFAVPSNALACGLGGAFLQAWTGGRCLLYSFAPDLEPLSPFWCCCIP